VSKFLNSLTHVAVMVHGVAVIDWESLKRNENRCEMTQHAKLLFLLATPAGFEPATLSLEDRRSPFHDLSNHFI
jgi:hypothetical protein